MSDPFNNSGAVNVQDHVLRLSGMPVNHTGDFYRRRRRRPGNLEAQPDVRRRLRHHRRRQPARGGGTSISAGAITPCWHRHVQGSFTANGFGRTLLSYRVPLTANGPISATSLTISNGTLTANGPTSATNFTAASGGLLRPVRARSQ